MFKSKCNSCDGIYEDSADIRFTKICDNKCDFCIEKNGISFDCSCKPNVKELIKSTIKSGKGDILILGGEPFLYPNELLEYIKGIKYAVNTIYITTSIPYTFKDEKYYSTICEILEIIDGLNVSFQHFDSEVNNSILNASNKFNRIDAISKYTEKYANKMRISINLVKGYIDNYDSLFKFYETMNYIGVKHIKINELQHSEDLYVSYERDIIKSKMKSAYSYGCQTEIIFDKFSNIKTTLKRSCFLVENSNKAYFVDLLKGLYIKILNIKNLKLKTGHTVIYENGFVSKNGWIKNKK